MVDTLSTSTRSAPYGGDIDARAMGSITNAAVFAQQTYAVACSEMIDVFTSCTNKISGFTDLAIKDQASCYCCQTAGSSEVWTNAIGDYASTCADWAITGESVTAYSVAKTFATLCDDYTDVCGGSAAATATSDSYSGYTSDSTTGNQNVVTVTGKGSSSSSTSSSGSGSGSSSGSSKGLSTGAIAGIAAGVGVVALLGLAGLFLFFWKKRRPAAATAPAPAMTQQNQPAQQPFNGNGQQPPMAPVAAAAGYQQYNGQQPPYNGQQPPYNGQQPPYNGQQSPPPEMQQYNQVHPDQKIYQNSPQVPYQPSPSPQQTAPSPYQTPSPYQPNAAVAAWPNGQQPPQSQHNQMNFAAVEMPTHEMAGHHIPTAAQELQGEDHSRRFSELPSEVGSPQPPHGQPHH